MPRIDKDEVVSIVKSCILSEKDGVLLRNINRDYRNEVGTPIPFKDFGFTSLEGFLQCQPEIKLKLNQFDEIVLNVQINEKIAHLSTLISRQKNKSDKLRKRMPDYSSRVKNNNGYRSYNKQYSNGGTSCNPPSYRCPPGRTQLSNRPPPALSPIQHLPKVSQVNYPSIPQKDPDRKAFSVQSRLVPSVPLLPTPKASPIQTRVIPPLLPDPRVTPKQKGLLPTPFSSPFLMPIPAYMLPLLKLAASQLQPPILSKSKPQAAPKNNEAEWPPLLRAERVARAPPVEARDATPLKPRAATPLEQRDATPLEPRTAMPPEQRDATPLEPRNATPLEQRNATPLEQCDATPLEPRAVTPLEPRDAPPRCDKHGEKGGKGLFPPRFEKQLAERNIKRNHPTETYAKTIQRINTILREKNIDRDQNNNVGTRKEDKEDNNNVGTRKEDKEDNNNVGTRKEDNNNVGTRKEDNNNVGTRKEDKEDKEERRGSVRQTQEACSDSKESLAGDSGRKGHSGRSGLVVTVRGKERDVQVVGGRSGLVVTVRGKERDIRVVPSHSRPLDPVSRTLCGYTLVGDDMFAHLCRDHLAFPCTWTYGRLISGLCLGEATLQEIRTSLRPPLRPPPRLLICLGRSDLKKGKSGEKAGRSLRKLVEGLVGRADSVVVCTLPIIQERNLPPTFHQEASYYNFIVRQLADEWKPLVQLVDLHKVLSRRQPCWDFDQLCADALTAIISSLCPMSILFP